MAFSTSVLLKRLNRAQYQAATHLQGPLLVLAGAGSGKTRVVIYRTAYLLQNGISPRNILLMTFTNKAAEEIKERLSKLTGKQAITGLTVCTFHALCVRILHREIGALGFKSKYSIFDKSDQRQILFEVFKEIKVDPEAFNHEEILKAISLSKNKLIAPKDYPIENDYDRLVKWIYQQFQEHLKQFNALDFDDLLYYTAILWREHPSVLAKYQRRFKYIMIDEYQDTNHAQYCLAASLAKSSQNIMVVGDDDQSIYGWRGADISNILNFERIFAGTKTIKLEANYRSTAPILLSAHALICNNEDRKAKKLKSMIGEGEKIKIIEAKNPWHEAEQIAEEILLKRLKFNRSYRDYAILFRTHTQSKPFEETFQRMNIPYQVSNQFDFYDRKEIKDALAYLKLLNNVDDDLSFLRIINYPKRGVGPGTLRVIRERALQGQMSLYQSAKDLLATDFFSQNLKEALGHFFELIEGYQRDINSPHMAEMFKEFLRHAGFMDEITREDLQKAERRLGFIDEFINTIETFAKKAKTPTLHLYLTKLALFFSSSDLENEDGFAENAVFLMTIHASKGLEFPYVYICGVEEKSLPFQREEGDEMQIHEERRLCYVAMTRAQRELSLSYCYERKRHGQKERCHPSRYLAEMPQEHVLRADSVLEDQSPESKEDLGKLTFKKINSLFKEKDEA